MFQTIFKYELKYWLKQPSIYIYAVLLCLIAMAQMMENAGVFKTYIADGDLVRIANSSLGIFQLINKFSILLFFLIPTLIGNAFYRDFKENTHALLYTFPISKRDYLGANFLAAFLILLCLVGFFLVGLAVGAHWTETLFVNDFNVWIYSRLFTVFLVPNLLFLGALVMATMLLTRNIYASFIIIILLSFLQELAGSLVGNMGNGFWSAIFDPFGQEAIQLVTTYWTIQEQNEWLLPIQGVVIYNRIFWLIMTCLMFGWIYRTFSFSKNVEYAFSIRSKNKFLSKSPKQKLGHLLKVKVSKVTYDFSFWQQLKATWQLSLVELTFILKSGLFLTLLGAGILVVLFKQAEINPAYGYETLPVTWSLLSFPLHNFSGTINILTFLYAGILVHRAKLAKANYLVDITPMPNWSFLLSKFMALVKMQMILLSFLMIGGIAVQLSKGYYEFEIGHYLTELYGVNLIHFIIWAMAAIFIQTLVKNPYLGFFLLILGFMGTGNMHLLGLEHSVFKFNGSPFYYYSDMDGYGRFLRPYFAYKLYWFTFGIFLLVGAYCWWPRGLTDSFLQRFKLAVATVKGPTVIWMTILFISFLGMGFSLWSYDNIWHQGISKERRAAIKKNSETTYQHFQNTPQPKIISVDSKVDIYPAEGYFKAVGEYVLVNQTKEIIDSLLVIHDVNVKAEYQLSSMVENRYFRQVSQEERRGSALSTDSSKTLKLSTKSLLKDTILAMGGILTHFEILHLKEGLKIGDSLKFMFQISTHQPDFLQGNSMVKSNGTFIANSVFPRFGYWGVSNKPNPNDTAALYQASESLDADWVNFKTIISTSEEQTAFAPGDLTKEWEQEGRRYFRYQTKDKIPYHYSFQSGKFALKKEHWKGIDLAIYHHPNHTANLDYMMEGMKASLAYCEHNFSSYQHKKASIIEVPRTYGRFARSMAGFFPFSESLGFISDVDNSKEGGANPPFVTTAHEVAHQWWMHQVVPANAQGEGLILEGLCQYIALMQIKHHYGKAKLLQYLESERNWYFNGKANDRGVEPPMNLVEDQPHLLYAKGTLVFYALSEFIGEERLNKALRTYLQKTKFQDAPFTTSLELVAHIRTVTPDSLQYLITDLLETVTWYENKIEAMNYKELPSGQYQVDINFQIKKYEQKGREKQLLPLADYIELGVFDAKGEILYLQRHKIIQTENSLTILVDKLPNRVEIDPNRQLIEQQVWDNVKK